MRRCTSELVYQRGGEAGSACYKDANRCSPANLASARRRIGGNYNKVTYPEVEFRQFRVLPRTVGYFFLGGRQKVSHSSKDSPSEEQNSSMFIWLITIGSSLEPQEAKTKTKEPKANNFFMLFSSAGLLQSTHVQPPCANLFAITSL